MGAVKTDHKRKEDIRAIKIALKHWDREDQAAEQNENRRRKRALITMSKDRDVPIKPTSEICFTNEGGVSKEILHCRTCAEKITKRQKYCSNCGQRILGYA